MKRISSTEGRRSLGHVVAQVGTPRVLLCLAKPCLMCSLTPLKFFETNLLFPSQSRVFGLKPQGRDSAQHRFLFC